MYCGCLKATVILEQLSPPKITMLQFWSVQHPNSGRNKQQISVISNPPVFELEQRHVMYFNGFQSLVDWIEYQFDSILSQVNHEVHCQRFLKGIINRGRS